MRKQKDAKVGSPQWVAAWQRILVESFVMRCIIEQGLDSLRFWMEVYLINKGTIYKIQFERFLGATVAQPAVIVRVLTSDIGAFLPDLDYFWSGKGAALKIEQLKLAVPHRGFIRPFGCVTTVFLVETNHPALMANYGAVSEWLRHASQGHAVTRDDLVCGILMPRFENFLCRQELSVLKDTIGQAVSVPHV